MNLRLSVQKSPKVNDEFRHAGPAVAIGRNPDGDLVLDHDAVSWDHARIELSPYQATITDLGSTNGTFKNGQKIAGATPLWPGDAIKLGTSGPTLTIVELDLTSNGAVPPPVTAPRPAFAAAIPVAKMEPTRKASKPVVSETRGIAMQAVQELMAQQTELRAQQDAHARQKRNFTVASLVVLLLLALLAGGLFYFRNDLGLIAKKTDEHETALAAHDKELKKISREVDTVADRFGKIDQQLEDQRKAQEKTDQSLNQLAMAAAKAEATQRGGMDKLGASLEQINQRIAKLNEKPANGAPAAAKAPVVPARPPGIPEKPIRIEPGQKVSVVLKNGPSYTGSYIGMTEKTVKVQTIADPSARASEWDIREVQAFQTRDGIFAFNEAAGQFEPGVTFFRFNKSSQQMERLENTQDTYLMQEAQIFGATNSAKALLSLGPTGEWCIGLPIPSSRSPQAIPAYHFKEVVTTKGVYTYDESKQDYVFKSHTDYARETKEATDKYWADWRQKNWDRRVQEYQLGTERVKALAPLFWSRWWWW
jgi:pSer/pThr/pTyr-binding forkhead associated (FHA) protein